MSTYTQAPPDTGTIRLISANAGMHLILENATDRYGPAGNLIGTTPGKKVKFRNCEADMRAEWMPLLERSPHYRVSVWRADDLNAAYKMGRPAGPVVVEGARSAAVNREMAPPIPNWDTTGPRDLRPMILAGRISDPARAMAYEVGHLAREQVMTALAQAIARSGGEVAEPERPTEPPAVSVPPGTKGL